MDYNTTHLAVERSARIATLGNPGDKTKPVWVVLHGYGQLVPYFIRHFRVLARMGQSVIAPEGLNRFYLEGTGGRVGATWMTKEERLTDIDDYVNYLNRVGRRFELYDGDRLVYVLGFSQGASTAVRWCGYGDISPKALVLWAGSFPPDLDWSVAFDKIQRVPVHYVYGKQDPYLESFRVQEVVKNLEKKGLSVSTHTFDGRHAINPELLGKLAKENLSGKKNSH